MKKKLLAIALLFAFALSLFGCGAKPEETVDPPAPQETPEAPPEAPAEPPEPPAAPAYDWTENYGDVLDDFYEFIFNADPDDEELYGSVGVGEVLGCNERIGTLRSVGYAIEDLSGDGIPELLIGAIDPDDPERRGSEIYTVYSYTDGAPKGLLQGWARSNYQLLDDGSFFYRGSGGAMYGGFGRFHPNEDASELLCDDFYFCEPDGENYEGFVFYHNTSGIWDMSVSDVLDMPDDDFWALADGLEGQRGRIAFTPFAEYFNEEVRVQSADELPGDVAAKSIVLAKSEMPAELVFFVKDRVTDFKILGRAQGDDFPSFTDELYAQAELTADTPLAVTLQFIGDIPSYAVSYVDSEGETQTFAIADSGMDGLIFLMEL